MSERPTAKAQLAFLRRCDVVYLRIALAERELEHAEDHIWANILEKRTRRTRNSRPARQVIKRLPPRTAGFNEWVAARLEVNPRTLLGAGAKVRGSSAAARARTVAARTAKLGLELTHQEVADLLGFGAPSAAGTAYHRAEQCDSLKKDSDKLIADWKNIHPNQTNGK